MGFQGSSNPLKFNAEYCGYVCKYISLDGGLSFHHQVFDPQTHCYRETLGTERCCDLPKLQNKIKGFPQNTAYSLCWRLLNGCKNHFCCRALYFILHLKPNSMYTFSLFESHSHRVLNFKKRRRKKKKEREKPLPPKSTTVFLTVKCGLMQITFSKLNILKSGN